MTAWRALVAVLGCLAVAWPSSTDAALVAGAAQVDLTPTKRVPLAGFSRRKGRLSTGVHDPLSVRALALRDGEADVVLVSADLLIIDERLMDAVRRLVHERHPDRNPVLLLAATHTHSGSGAYGRKWLEKISMGSFDAELFAWLVARIADAIEGAWQHLEPVAASYHSVPTDGLVVNRIEADGIHDPELVVLGVWGSDERLVAAVVGFGAHPTTLGAWNMQLSADYPGVVTRHVEQAYPGSVCLFMAGAVGDQAPVKQGKDFEPAAWLGDRLAQHALALLAADARQPLTVMTAAQETVPLPPARIRLGRRRLPSWISRWFVDDDATVTVVRAGDVVLMGLPCDVGAELGLALKERVKAQRLQPVVIGFANDYIGYCLPERLYTTDAYEAQMVFNGPRTGQVVVETATRLLERVIATPQ